MSTAGNMFYCSPQMLCSSTVNKKKLSSDCRCLFCPLHMDSSVDGCYASWLMLLLALLKPLLMVSGAFFKGSCSDVRHVNHGPSLISL